MAPQHLAPLPALRDMVESLWIQDAAPTRPAERTPTCVVPTGTVELLFHYGDPIVHVERDGERRMPWAYLTGQRTLPVFTKATGTLGIVLVSLHPWGSEALLPGTAALIDGYTDLGEIVGVATLEPLRDQLAQARSDTERVDAVQRFLLGLRARRRVDGRVILAARRILAGPQTSVDALAADLQLSRAHFSRLFRAGVGLRPKTLMGITRFQRALRLHRTHAASWGAIAAACGYSDQAHLVREVRRYTARTPTQLELRRPAAFQLFNGANSPGSFDTVYL